MEQNNYHSSITVNVPAAEAYAGIANVSGWWAKSFKGSALHTGDKFRVEFGTTSVDFEIAEAIPGKKCVWHVSDCHLPWLKDQNEWTGTEVLWELTPQGNATRIDMTHIGLVPEVECYEACEKGWNGHVTGSLLKLLNEGVGEPL